MIVVAGGVLTEESEVKEIHSVRKGLKTKYVILEANDRCIRYAFLHERDHHA